MSNTPSDDRSPEQPEPYGRQQPGSYGEQQPGPYGQQQSYQPPQYGPPQPWQQQAAYAGYQSPGVFGGYAPVGTALRNAAPVSAGLQIAANFVDGLITGVIGLVVFFASLGPAYANLLSYSATSPTSTSRTVAGQFAAQAFTGMAVFGVVMLALGIFLWWWLAKKGKSFGFAVFGLRLVSAQDGQPLGWGKTFLRYLVMSLGSSLTGGLLGLLFWLSPLFDSTSGWFRAWQDKMVDGVMINHKLGQDTLAPR